MSSVIRQNTRTRSALTRLIPLALVVFALLLTAACGQEGVSGTPQSAPEGTAEPAPVVIDESSEAADLRAQLLADGEATIALTEDVEITVPLVVNGDKTVTGDAELKLTEDADAIFTMNPGSKLTVDGITVNGAFKAQSCVFVEVDCLFTLKSGTVHNAVRHCVDSYGDVTVMGGTMSTPGESWIYMERGGNLNISDGYFGHAGLTGILTGRHTVTEITGGTYEGAGLYAIFNRGDLKMTGGRITGTVAWYGIGNAHNMVLDGPIEISDSQQRGLILNLRDAVGYVNGLTLRNAGANGIVNTGDLVVENTTLDKCTTSMVYNYGDYGNLTLRNMKLSNGLYHAIWNAATITCENVSFDNIAKKCIINAAGDVYCTNVSARNCQDTVFYNANISTGVYEYGTMTIRGCDIADCTGAGVHSIGGDLVLEDATISSVKANLFVSNGTGTIKNVKLLGTSDGVASGFGVGTSSNSNATVTCENVYVTGGARGITNYGTLTLTDCTVTRNGYNSEVMFGGGISSPGTLTMYGGSITDNFANKAGGGIRSQGTVELNDVEITGNRAKKGAGGGVCVSSGTVKLRNCVISSNRSYSSGGGIFNEKGSVTLSGCSVRRNRTDNGSGGGIANYKRMSISGGTIGSNRCHNYGAGVYTDGKLTMSRVKIKDNTSGGTCGGIANADTMTLSGCTFSGNTDAFEATDFDIYSSSSKRPTKLTLKGSVTVGNIYRGPTTVLTLDDACELSNTSELWFSTSSTSQYYCPGRVGLSGSATALAAKYTKFTLPADVTRVFLGEDGKLHNSDGSPDPVTSGIVNLVRDGEVVASGTIVEMLAAASDGDTLVLTENISIGEPMTFNKDVVITDDGTPRTVTSGVGMFNVLTFNGSEDDKPSASIIGTSTGGITFDGQGMVRERPWTAIVNAKLTLTNVNFTNMVCGGVITGENSLYNNGAAMRIGTGGVLNMTGGSITNCSNTVRSGAALVSTGEATLKGVTISGNSSATFAGALYDAGVMTLEDCTLTNNTATTTGGAISTEGTTTVRNCTFTGNTATTNGGAIYGNSRATVVVEDSTFTGNTAGGSGGAMNVKGSLSVKNTSVTANTAANYAGAIYTAGAFTFDGSTATGNTATAQPSSSDICAELGFDAAGELDIGNILLASDNATRTPVIRIAEGSSLKSGAAPALVKKNNAGIGTALLGGAGVAGGAGVFAYYDPTLLTVDNTGKLVSLVSFEDSEAYIDNGTADPTVYGPLQAVLMSAADGDTVVLKKNAVMSGSVTIAKDVTLTDDGIPHTVTSTETAANTFIVAGSATDKPIVSIIGTATGGITFDGEGTVRERPWMAIVNAELTLENVTFTNMVCGGVLEGSNSLYNNGAAMRIGSGGVLNMTGGSITNCSNTVRCGAALASTGEATFTGVTISGNSAKTFAGALYDAGVMTLVNCTVSNNTATTTGGAISTEGTTTVRNCTFTGNTATSHGGAIYGNSRATVVVEDSTFTGNTSRGSGGAMNVKGPLTVKNTSVTSNTAANYAGGIYTAGAFTFDSSAVTGNTATAQPDSADICAEPGLDAVGAIAIGKILLAGDNSTRNASVRMASAITLKDGAAAIVIKKVNAAVGAQLISGDGLAASRTLFATHNTAFYGIDDEGKLASLVSFADSEAYIDNGTATPEIYGPLSLVIGSANAGDTVVIKKNVTIAEGAQLQIRKDITLTDDGTARTITGLHDASGAIRFWGTETDPATVTVRGTAEGGLTITGNNADRTSSLIRVTYSELTLDGNVTITGAKNVSTSTDLANRGGAIYLMGACTLNLENGASITGNDAGINYGGAVYSLGTVNVNNGTISNNRAARGGGICVTGGIVNVNANASITGNTSTRGGGIYAGGGTVNVAEGASITNNTATANFGGGISLNGAATSRVVANIAGTVTGNDVTGQTGGVHSGNTYGTINILSGATITGNTETNTNRSADVGSGGTVNVQGTVAIGELYVINGAAGKIILTGNVALKTGAPQIIAQKGSYNTAGSTIITDTAGELATSYTAFTSNVAGFTINSLGQLEAVSSGGASVQGGEATPTPVPEDVTTPAPEATPTPVPGDVTTPIPEDVTTPAPETAPTPVPEDVTMPAPETTPTPVPEDVTTPAPETTPTPAPDGVPTPAPDDVPTPAPETTPTPAPETTPTPAPKLAPTPAPAPNPEPAATPTAVPEAE